MHKVANLIELYNKVINTVSEDVLFFLVLIHINITTKILYFREDFSEDFVLILTKDLSIVRTINSPYKM